MRPVPQTPSPFSTPRAWASLSRTMDLAEEAGILTPKVVRALAFGRISAKDAAVFCVYVENNIQGLLACDEYIKYPEKLPSASTERWFVLHGIRTYISSISIQNSSLEYQSLLPEQINHFWGIGYA